jgi:hypothetical protein
VAEELRFFLRTAIWIGGAGLAYWLVSSEPAGTVLLGFLLAALVAVVVVAAALAPTALAGLPGSGPLGAIARLVGFTERPDDPPPLHGGPEVVPLGSTWPIVTAGALVVVGAGLIFGAWLLLPGVALLVAGGLGWLTQLDR